MKGRALPCNQVSISQFMPLCQDLCQQVIQLRPHQAARRRCSSSNTRPRKHTTVHDLCTVLRLGTLSTLRLSMVMCSRVLASRLRWHRLRALVLRMSTPSKSPMTGTRANRKAMASLRVNTLTPVPLTAHEKPPTLVCPTLPWAKCTQTRLTSLQR